MTPTDLLGAFVTGILAVAILSLVVAPKSTAANVVMSFGQSFAGIVDSAKAYPA